MRRCTSLWIAGFLAVASSLRVATTPLRHCAAVQRRAVISASATDTKRLLEECAKPDSNGPERFTQLIVADSKDQGAPAAAGVDEQIQDVQFQLSVAGLCYSTPDGKRQLAKNLRFTVSEGMGVVIRGPSGCGKSSLIRCATQRAPRVLQKTHFAACSPPAACGART